jgi:hypothetical protein
LIINSFKIKQAKENLFFFITHLILLSINILQTTQQQQKEKNNCFGTAFALRLSVERGEIERTERF